MSVSIEDMVAAHGKKRERERINDASMSAAKSGGISGALLQGAAQVLHGNRSIPSIIGKSALTGLGAGALTGGATYLGSSILGAPEEGTSGGFTNRAGLGGALAGGALGAGLGGLLGAGKLGWLSKTPTVAAELEKAGPLNNLLADQIKKVAKKGAGRTAAALGIGGGIIGANLGANEGMAVDYLESLDDEDPSHGPY